jgi:hypothetical protein
VHTRHTQPSACDHLIVWCTPRVSWCRLALADVQGRAQAAWADMLQVLFAQAVTVYAVVHEKLTHGAWAPATTCPTGLEVYQIVTPAHLPAPHHELSFLPGRKGPSQGKHDACSVAGCTVVLVLVSQLLRLGYVQLTMCDNSCCFPGSHWASAACLQRLRLDQNRGSFCCSPRVNLDLLHPCLVQLRKMRAWRCHS